MSRVYKVRRPFERAGRVLGTGERVLLSDTDAAELLASGHVVPAVDCELLADTAERWVRVQTR